MCGEIKLASRLFKRPSTIDKKAGQQWFKYRPLTGDELWGLQVAEVEAVSTKAGREPTRRLTRATE